MAQFFYEGEPSRNLWLKVLVALIIVIFIDSQVFEFSDFGFVLILLLIVWLAVGSSITDNYIKKQKGKKK